MKNLISLLVLVLIAQSTLAQNTSRNNYKGLWNTNSTWLDNSAPTTNGSYNPPITIQGYITRAGNLTISNGTTLTVNDTLWVEGDLTLSGGGTLRIGNEGLLIVDGNTNANNGANIDVDGIVVVLGNVNMANGVNVDPNGGEPYVFGQTRYGGTNYSAAVPGESNLANDYPELYQQIMNRTLPVELVAFTAKANSSTVLLEWSTAMEKNFDYFTVERANADLNFQPIGEVRGQGNKNTETFYSFEDRHPRKGQAYYRLKATDFDGSVEYHKVTAVYFEGLASFNTKVYPNPVNSNQMTIESTNSLTQNIKLLDLSGKAVYTQSIQMGKNEINLPASVRPGAYLLLMENEQGLQSQERIIIL